MSNITDFHNTKVEKANREIKELCEIQHKATDELEELLNQMDLRSANGIKATEEEMIALFRAMGKLAKANTERNEACIRHPNHKPLMEDVDIENEVKKVMHGDVIPLFVPDEELDRYFAGADTY